MADHSVRLSLLVAREKRMIEGIQGAGSPEGRGKRERTTRHDTEIHC
jgi:hypothetical protein